MQIVVQIEGTQFRRWTDGVLVEQRQATPAELTKANDPAVANAKTTEQLVRGSMANLQVYRDQASPTNAQTVAVVRLLCRVVLGLVRRELNDFSATD